MAYIYVLYSAKFLFQLIRIVNWYILLNGLDDLCGNFNMTGSRQAGCLCGSLKDSQCWSNQVIMGQSVSV